MRVSACVYVSVCISLIIKTFLIKKIPNLFNWYSTIFKSRRKSKTLKLFLFIKWKTEWRKKKKKEKEKK